MSMTASLFIILIQFFFFFFLSHFVPFRLRITNTTCETLHAIKFKGLKE